MLKIYELAYEYEVGSLKDLWTRFHVTYTVAMTRSTVVAIS